MAAALEWQANHALQRTEVLGPVGGKKACKDVDRPEAGIARGDPVAAFNFQKVQEPDDPFSREIGNLQSLDRPLRTLGNKLQQQQEGIAITVHRVRTQSPLR